MTTRIRDTGASVLRSLLGQGGTSAFVNLAGLPTELRNMGHGGGNSGAVISPAPGLGLSSYQDPRIVVLPIRRKDF